MILNTDILSRVDVSRIEIEDQQPCVIIATNKINSIPCPDKSLHAKRCIYCQEYSTWDTLCFETEYKNYIKLPRNLLNKSWVVYKEV